MSSKSIYSAQIMVRANRKSTRRKVFRRSVLPVRIFLKCAEHIDSSFVVNFAMHKNFPCENEKISVFDGTKVKCSIELGISTHLICVFACGLKVLVKSSSEI